MKRRTTLTTLFALPAVALLAASCGSAGSDGGGSDGSGSDSLPDVSAPAVNEPAAADPSVPEGDLPADELAGNRVVFVWSETGGCAMAGPNCARYEVTVDGTVATMRLDAVDSDGAPEPEATGQVDPALVQTWRDALASEDLDALRERVGEGELTAAFDGVDYLVSNPAADIELSSVATDFDRTEPVFAAAWKLAEAAAGIAPLDLQGR